MITTTKTIMSNAKDKEEFTRICNCRDKTSCPLKGKRLQDGVVYKVVVTQRESRTQYTYIGITKNHFKTISIIPV